MKIDTLVGADVLGRPLLFAALLAVAAWFAPAQAAKMPTRLDVTARPEGAIVSIDGVERGPVPLTLVDVTPGPHLVHVAAPNYQPADEVVHLAEESFTQRDYSLVREKGLVLVRTEPAGADVRIRGISVGHTPLLLTDLPSGETHPAELLLNGYQVRRIELTPEGRVPLVRDEQLVLDSGLLACISDPVGAEVTINGFPRGLTPVSVTNVPRGVATVSFRLAGFETETRELQLAAGDVKTLAVTLQPKGAALSVVTEPEGARVFVDGNFQGKAPVRSMLVRPGAHKVRVELAGYGTEERQVEVANGGTSTAEFKLASVQGRMEVCTMPANAKIILDGKAVGLTRPLKGTNRSQIFAIERVDAGNHSLLIRADGCSEWRRTVRIPPRETLKINARLTQLFIPDVEVETVHGIRRGVLVSNGPEGLVLEERPGARTTFPKNEVRRISPIERK